MNSPAQFDLSGGGLGSNAFSLGGGGGPKPLDIQTALSASAVQQDGQIAVAVKVGIPEPLHINPNDPDPPKSPEDPTLIPTQIKVVDSPEWLTVKRILYPEAKVITLKPAVGPEKQLRSYIGNITVYVPLVVSSQAPLGDTTLKLDVSWQACNDDQCFLPENKVLEVPITVVSSKQAIEATNADDFAAFNPAVYAEDAVPVASPADSDPLASFDFLGSRFALSSSGLIATSLILLIALVAGALLNFTPCVLPVMPLKIMSLHHQAGNPARCFALGISFSLGILSCFLVLGALAAGLVSGIETLQWGQQFSSAWFTITLGLIVGVMGVGMLGLFSMQLPQSVYKFSPNHDTHFGSFLFGILTAILSTPCTGPMFAGSLAWALKQPAWLGLTTFVTMGLGMALPYLLLTLNPKWVDKLPRSGPGSVLVKEVMGGLLIAVAIYFFGIAGKSIWGGTYWWLVAIVVSVAFVWLMVKTISFSQRIGVRLAVSVISLLFISGIWWTADVVQAPGPVSWGVYQPDVFDEARGDNKIVVLEFTADWCVNCKALEAAVLKTERIANRLNQEDVVPLKVDLTQQSNVTGWAKLKELGATGIPLTAVYHPGKEPILLTSIYTVDALLGVINDG